MILILIEFVCLFSWFVHWFFSCLLYAHTRSPRFRSFINLMLLKEFTATHIYLHIYWKPWLAAHKCNAYNTFRTIWEKSLTTYYICFHPSSESTTLEKKRWPVCSYDDFLKLPFYLRKVNLRNSILKYKLSLTSIKRFLLFKHSCSSSELSIPQL